MTDAISLTAACAVLTEHDLNQDDFSPHGSFALVANDFKNFLPQIKMSNFMRSQYKQNTLFNFFGHSFHNFKKNP